MINLTNGVAVGTSKENPIIVEKEDLPRVIEWRKTLLEHLAVYAQITCQGCGKTVIKNMARTKEKLCSIKFLSYCRPCSQKNACQEKYGCDNVFQLESSKQKIKETSQERYGAESWKKSDVGKEAFKQYSLERYGTENPYQSEEVKQKAKKTMIEHYGVDSPLRSTKIREKQKQTFKERYGVEHALQNSEFLNKARHHNYHYDNYSFDSSWECAYYIYQKDHNATIEREPEGLNYICDGETHKYFPDFRVNGRFVEIKGDQFFNKNNELSSPYITETNKRQRKIKAKYQCMLDNNVLIIRGAEMKEILKYIKTTYGRTFLSSLRKEL